ncbi:Uncharacterized conserved protein, DUF1800 family [Roseateles sp. YR242]|uniref:DUF1800 domain-containing protein n=1 Tax=Roseateles sp. YR242 TaxID=1855305 RepID=UPI0008D43845|nr:DUF1800 domain-containing protein [Roseateles sp. YR242]SEL21371.1 Uncharacterized conserved protein, DUF1800 family [Roseateles sp. YR242]
MLTIATPSAPHVSAAPGAADRALDPDHGGLSAVAAAAAAAALLAACGGGSESDAGDTPNTVPHSAKPETDAEAARFLGQAGFAAVDTDLTSLKSIGYSRWLDQQFSAARTTSHTDWLIAKGYGAESYRYSLAGVDATLWRKLISSPDQLRQRVVLALSEIFVVSMNGLPVAWPQFATSGYVDMLEARCFGTFRELLEGVTLSPAMGVYLAMRGNRKEDTKTGRQPDENYAREVMQLFTIGLNQLNADGSAKTSGGKTIDTYSLDQITALARVFTGWDFDTAAPNGTDFSYMNRPMVNTASRFSTGTKQVLDVSIPESADGPAAMKAALDTLTAHPNVGPFIGRQLIQRLVASNPSGGYVQRVAAVFDNNGQGVRGDMRAVIRAILLDNEARTASTTPDGGKLREPVQRLVQWTRSVGFTSPGDLWAIGDCSNPATRLGQSPLRSGSVFNFFRPGYVPPNSELGNNNVTAPEFQLCNESTVAGYLNFMQTLVNSGIGDMKPDYTADLALAADATSLVQRQANLLGGVSETTLTLITTAVGAITGTTDAGKLNRVKAGWLLLLASPDYQIQK